MIIERSESPQWTSNSYLVADREGGHAILVDANDRVAPLVDAARRLGVTVDALVLTHEHGDHTAGVAEYREHLGPPVLAHPTTRAALEGFVDVDRTIGDGDVIEAGDLRAEVIAIPGHTAGQIALLVGGTDLFTADALFKGTVGGTLAPGHTTYADHRASLERLLALPPETVVHPGHTLPTTIGDEREHNPFVRIWNGTDPEGADEVTVRGRPATLVLWAPDYDGTNKAWVRFRDDGADAIVGGSQVRR
jgi:hydroxyacylglutathione hydrolase